MNIPERYRVSVKAFRKKKDKTITINGFKKTKVTSALKKSIISGDVAQSIKWAVELHCSFYRKELWNIFLDVMSKHIHRENPLLPIFIHCQYQNHIQQLAVTEPMNNQQCRNRITEVTAVLALSPCRKIPKIKMAKDTHEFQNDFQKYSVAPHLHFLRGIWKDNDCIDIRIPLNEFAFQLKKQDHTTDTQSKCLFWLYWIFDWEGKEKKKSKKISTPCPTVSCARRINKYTDTEWATDYIWILWSICFSVLHTSPISNKRAICQCLFQLFCHDYKTSKRTSKRKFLIHAVLVILDTLPQLHFSKSVFVQYPIVLQSVLRINTMYKKISDAATAYSQQNRQRQKQQSSRNSNEMSSRVTYDKFDKQIARESISPTHPFFDYYMQNELYLNPTYQEATKNTSEKSGILHHLDKFFGW